MKKYLADTNFVLRFLLGDVTEQSETAKKYFLSAKTAKISIFIPLLVIAEVNFVLMSFYRFPKDKVNEKLFNFIKTPYIEIENRNLLLEAILVSKDKNISFIDAIFAVAAKLSGREFLTFDKTLKKLKI